MFAVTSDKSNVVEEDNTYCHNEHNKDIQKLNNKPTNKHVKKLSNKLIKKHVKKRTNEAKKQEKK
jgi:hypothetical protein